MALLKSGKMKRINPLELLVLYSLTPSLKGWVICIHNCRKIIWN
jgi:hypothetical protein